MFFIKQTIMLKFVLLFCSTFAIQQVSSSPSSEDLSDYYWREFTGVIPSDAIPGGTDKSGKRTYIGQMYSPTYGLLPGTIYSDSKHVRASGGGKSFSSDNFEKILCSRNHEKYYWIPTRNEDSHLLTNCQLVIGGTELGFVLNIGRVNHEMETVIGKVFAQHTAHGGLHIPNKSTEAHYQTYEILTYNCYTTHNSSNITYVSVY